MAVTFDAHLESQALGSSPFSHNHVSVAKNPTLAVVAISTRATTIGTPTWNGVAMTFIGSDAFSTSIQVAVYYLKNPAGGTQTVSCTISGGTLTGIMCSTTWLGTHPDRPIGDFQSANSPGQTNPSIRVLANPEDQAMGVLATAGAGTDTAGQTLIYHAADGTTTGDAERTAGKGYNTILNWVDAGNLTRAWLAVALQGGGIPDVDVVNMADDYGPMFMGPPGFVEPDMRIYTPGAATIFQQALDAFVTTSASFQLQTNKLLTATVPITATIQKQANKFLTATAAMFKADLIKQVNKPMSATATTTASEQRQANKQLSATVPTTATVQKQANKNLSATVTTIASVFKTVFKPLSATVTTLASLVARTTFAKNLTATVTTTASMVRLIQKPLSATSLVTGIMQRQTNKSLTANATTTASMQRQTNKSLLASVSVSATLATIKVFLVNLTATVTTSATFQKVVTKTFIGNVSVSGIMTKLMSKTLVGNATTTATAQKQVNKPLSATATVTATMQRSLIRVLTLVATVTTSATMARLTAKNLIATVNNPRQRSETYSKEPDRAGYDYGQLG
jgi:hypothetical protein